MSNHIGLIRTVLVDNDQSELDQLTAGMHLAQIPVLPLKYSLDTGVQNVPDAKFLCVRVLFVDMNLADASAPAAHDIAPTIAEVINSVVPVDNGPYALVFWSKHRHLADEVLEILGERHPEIPMPISVGALDKSEFRIDASTASAEDHSERLRKAIDDVVGQSPQLRALVNWERDIGRAASAALVALSNIIPRTVPWAINEHASNLSRTLARIAQEAAGQKNAFEHAAQAINLGLEPLLYDNLERGLVGAEAEEIWKLAMPDLAKASVVFADPTANRRLNTYYSVSQMVVDSRATDRGCFCEIPMHKINDETFIAIFGKTVNDLAEDFVNVGGLSSNTKKSIRASVKWGFIEISADCDVAQRKPRLNRFILAAVVPNDRAENTSFKSTTGSTSDRKHNAMYRMTEIELDSMPVIVFANYRYLLGLPATSDLLGKVFFRLRGLTLNELIQNYSTYVSRPGVISFS